MFVSFSVTPFCSSALFLQEKLDFALRKEVDGMGVPDIKYGDSVCYIQHVDTGLWLTYQSVDAKCARMGGVQRKVSASTASFRWLTLNQSWKNSLNVLKHGFPESFWRMITNIISVGVLIMIMQSVTL